MQETKDWTIKKIEALSYPDILLLADEWVDVKGHDVALVDFGGYFGYSALVCLNGGHLYYANDYELHHRNKSRDELRQWYLDTLPHRLFTEDELVSRGKDYDEQTRKRHYLTNYYGMQWPHVSAFGAKPEGWDELKSRMVFSCETFAYYDVAYAPEVKRISQLWDRLDSVTCDMEQEHDYLVGALVSEMCNHEYAINWQGNWDVLSCFSKASIEYDYAGGDQDLAFYFRQLGWGEDKRKCFFEAKRKYDALCAENDWF